MGGYLSECAESLGRIVLPGSVAFGAAVCVVPNEWPIAVIVGGLAALVAALLPREADRRPESAS